MLQSVLEIMNALSFMSTLASSIVYGVRLFGLLNFVSAVLKNNGFKLPFSHNESFMIPIALHTSAAGKTSIGWKQHTHGDKSINFEFSSFDTEPSTSNYILIDAELDSKAGEFIDILIIKKETKSIIVEAAKICGNNIYELKATYQTSNTTLYETFVNSDEECSLTFFLYPSENVQLSSKKIFRAKDYDFIIKNIIGALICVLTGYPVFLYMLYGLLTCSSLVPPRDVLEDFNEHDSCQSRCKDVQMGEHDDGFITPNIYTNNIRNDNEEDHNEDINPITMASEHYEEKKDYSREVIYGLDSGETTFVRGRVIEIERRSGWTNLLSLSYCEPVQNLSLSISSQDTVNPNESTSSFPSPFSDHSSFSDWTRNATESLNVEDSTLNGSSVPTLSSSVKANIEEESAYF